MNRIVLTLGTFVIALAVIVTGAAALGVLSDQGVPDPPDTVSEQYDPALLVPDDTPGEADIQPSAVESENTILIATGFGVNDRDIRPLTNALSEGDHSVEIGEPTPDALEAADGVVIVGNAIASPDDAEHVSDFIEDDGRLLVLADGFVEYEAGPERATFDSTLGMSIEPGYVYNMEDHDFDHLRIFAESAGNDELTEGVDRVMFQTATPVSLNAGDPILEPAPGAQLSTTRAPTDLSVVERDDNVVAIGDYSFLEPENAQRADNDAFIANLADFLVEGDRETTTDEESENEEEITDEPSDGDLMAVVEQYYEGLDAADAEIVSDATHPDSPMSEPTEAELEELADYQFSIHDLEVVEVDEDEAIVEGTEVVIDPDGEEFETSIRVALRPDGEQWLIWEFVPA